MLKHRVEANSEKQIEEIKCRHCGHVEKPAHGCDDHTGEILIHDPDCNFVLFDDDCDCADPDSSFEARRAALVVWSGSAPPITVIKCPCGDPVCNYHGLSNGQFNQGTGWQKDRAIEIANAVNLFDRLVDYLRKVPCPRADFAGDTCEFWAETYGQKRCSRCALLRLGADPKSNAFILEAVARTLAKHILLVEASGVAR